MYKFEISADSHQELRIKMLDFAKDMIAEQKSHSPQYIDDVPDQPDLPIYAPAPPQEYKTPFQVVSNPLPPIHPVPSPLIAEAMVQSATAPDRDSRGMPWDKRIHASSKAVTKDGSWRYQRGVTDEFVTKIEAELRGAPQQPQQPVPPPPPPTVAVQVPTFAPQSQPFDAVVSPVAVPPPAAVYENVTVPPGVRPAHTYATFKANMNIVVAQLIEGGKLDTEWLNNLKKYFGVEQIWNILASEAQCLELYNYLGQYGLITKMD